MNSEYKDKYGDIFTVDLDFDYQSCPCYSPCKHHHGYCMEDDVSVFECHTCPVHPYNAYRLKDIEKREPRAKEIIEIAKSLKESDTLMW